MFDRFEEFQKRILAIAARGEAILLDAQGREVGSLSNGRWEMVRTLREYQLFKQTRIFDPLIGRNDHRALKAERMKAECILFGEEFCSHVLKWSVVSILDQWAEYQPVALAKIEQIRRQLARERIGVAELLDIERAA